MYLSGDIFKNVCLEKVLQIIIEVSMLRSLILDILPGSWLKLQRPPCKCCWWKYIKKESPKSNLSNKNKKQCFQLVLDWTGTLFSRARFWRVWSRNWVPWNREKSGFIKQDFSRPASSSTYPILSQFSKFLLPETSEKHM